MVASPRASARPGRIGSLLLALIASPLAQAGSGYYADPSVFARAQDLRFLTTGIDGTRHPSLSADGRTVAFQDLQLRYIGIRPNLGEVDAIDVPGLLNTARDFALTLDGLGLSFAGTDPDAAAKGGCNRSVFFQFLTTGSKQPFGNASCDSAPSRPYAPLTGMPVAFSSNINPAGAPHPSSSIDAYFVFPGGFPRAKGGGALCLSCDQEPAVGSAVIQTASVDDDGINQIAHRSNSRLWTAPAGHRLAFVYSIAYAECAIGDRFCGESGLVIVDLAAGGGAVASHTLRVPQRNRFFEVHGDFSATSFVFSTDAGLVPEDTDDALDVYLYDTVTRQTRLITGGIVGSASSARISGNGRYATFVASESLSVVGAGRIMPPPPDTNLLTVVDTYVDRVMLVDLRSPGFPTVQVSEENRTDPGFAITDSTDLSYTGGVLALTTRLGLDGNDGNGANDVYLVANALALDEVFDSGFE